MTPKIGYIKNQTDFLFEKTLNWCLRMYDKFCVDCANGSEVIQEKRDGRFPHPRRRWRVNVMLNRPVEHVVLNDLNIARKPVFEPSNRL